MSFFGSRRQAQENPPSRSESPTVSPVMITQQPIGFETVLGANCVIEGQLESKGNIRLDGTFTGTLEITGNVLVGETAKITADINARNISIAGAVRGNVNGKKVQLLRTGRVWGDITATALTTEEGAFIDGKISMISSEPMEPLRETDLILEGETSPAGAEDSDKEDEVKSSSGASTELSESAVEVADGEDATATGK